MNKNEIVRLKSLRRKLVILWPETDGLRAKNRIKRVLKGKTREEQVVQTQGNGEENRKQNGCRTEAERWQTGSKTEAERMQNDGKPDAERNQEACNSLKTNDDVALSKVKESKVKESKVKESKVSTTTMWKQYVDSLQQEQEWKDIMTMRTGLKRQFFTLYPRMVGYFKQHVRLLGNEGQILSSGDAKHYFNTPGSPTFIRMMAGLQKPIDKGKYEDRDPTTGQRSCFG